MAWVMSRKSVTVGLAGLRRRGKRRRGGVRWAAHQAGASLVTRNTESGYRTRNSWMQWRKKAPVTSWPLSRQIK